MIRKEKFVPEEYYHVYNRVIFNSPIFRNNKNCERLMQAFLLANSTKSTQAFQFLRNHQDATTKDALKIANEGEKLVDVVCYAIMPDHYHLLLKEKAENGISKFIHKCNMSVAKYVNIKTDRRGPLFESAFKSKHIATNDYLLHLSLYIHLNPLDFFAGKQWREHRIQNWDKVRKQLIDYPYSSLKSFFDKNHDNKIISGTEIITEQFNNIKEYELFLREWSEENFNAINNLIMD